MSNGHLDAMPEVRGWGGHRRYTVKVHKCEFMGEGSDFGQVASAIWATVDMRTDRCLLRSRQVAERKRTEHLP